MKVLLEFNSINEKTLVWKEGMEDWDTISKLEEFTNQITSKIVSETNINSKSEEIADQIAPKIVPEANINPKTEEIADEIAPKIVPEPIINSKTEEIAEQIRSKKEPETILNSKPEEKIILDSQSKEMKNAVSSTDYIKWVKFISVIVLITSLLSLIGGIQQYFQFENTKEFDTSYIGPFSAWGALISFVLGIVCIIYLYRKKTNFYKNIVSVLLGLSAFLIINVTESNYRKFWMPYWKCYQLWDISQEKAKSIEDGWRTGKIDSDSLNILNKIYSISKNNNQIEEKKDTTTIVNKSTSNSDKTNDELSKIEKKIDDLTRKKIINDQIIMEPHNHEKAILSGRCQRTFCLWRGDSLVSADENKKIDLELKFLIDKKKRLLN
jgi:hypothetical protein